jgi:hypothetical protein
MFGVKELARASRQHHYDNFGAITPQPLFLRL